MIFMTNYFDVKVKTPVMKALLNRSLRILSPRTAMCDLKLI